MKEYTMTAKIDLTLVGQAEDTPELEARIRDYWEGYLRATVDEIERVIPMDNVTVSEVKLFIREGAEHEG